ncbi:MAG: hypothetical protein H0V29_12000 [Thermoleophilaceae bacterium]|nr:hypothetical protein [Thermoleophilaceae bacterium]
MRLGLAPALLLLVPVLAACGADDGERKEAETRVRQYVKATNERDPKLCSEYLSTAFLRASTGEKGEAAVKSCQQSLEQLGTPQQVKISLKKIEKVSLGGDPSVRVLLDVSGSEQRQTLLLTEEDGELKIAGTGK